MLIIIDPSLQSYNGHFLTYDKVLADEAGRRGERCVVFAARSVRQSIVGGLQIIPCFRHGLEASLDDKVLATAFLGDLITGVNSLELEPRSVLFLHTTTHRQIEPQYKPWLMKGCGIPFWLSFCDIPRHPIHTGPMLIRYDNTETRSYLFSAWEWPIVCASSQTVNCCLKNIKA